MTDLNLAGESYAHSLIAADKVDKTSDWSFDDATDGAKLLGKGGDDWENYGRHHLGLNRSANEKTKARYKYPFAKMNTVYRSGVIAAKQRAAQQNDVAIEKAASDLLELIDKPRMTSYSNPVFEYKFLDGVSQPGTFEGYAAVFGQKDDYGDVIAPGAFDRAIADISTSGIMPKMLLNHGGLPWGTQTPESMLPIGGWDSVAADSYGLRVKGHLDSLDTDFGRRLYAAMKNRRLDGLSMTYIARDANKGTKSSEPRRTITDVDLIEAGPVTYQAQPSATILQVKSLVRDVVIPKTVREFEAGLREKFGYSNAAAKSIAAGGFKASQSDPRDEDGIGDVIAGEFEKLAKLIRS